MMTHIAVDQGFPTMFPTISTYGESVMPLAIQNGYATSSVIPLLLLQNSPFFLVKTLKIDQSKRKVSMWLGTADNSIADWKCPLITV